MNIGIIIAFWAIFGVTAFAFALAVQMRILSGIALRRALLARDPSLEDQAARRSVVMAGNGAADAGTDAQMTEATGHLIKTYQTPLSWLRTMRVISKFAPFLLVAILVAGRVLKVI